MTLNVQNQCFKPSFAGKARYRTIENLHLPFHTVNGDKYKNYQYRIIWITQGTDLQENEALVDEFFTLYEDPSNFPDPDEREDPIFIRERIAEQTNNPHTHLMAYLLVSPTGDTHFAAGCIVEFYPDSACALVTYLFVDQKFRGYKVGAKQEKVAESLIKGDEGLKGLSRFFSQQYYKPVKAVLFESNNPLETEADKDSMPPAKRLKFFSRLGARRIDFSYIQPPLGDDKGLVTNLFLLTFPEFTQLTATIHVEVVISFVMELAKSLDRNKEANSVTRYGLGNYQHDLSVVRQLHGMRKISTSRPEMIGLSVDGINIINQMYNDLVDRRVNEDSVALTAIPGIEAE